MVWRPAEVEFLSIEQRGAELWQNVMVRDADGALHILEYQVIQGETGWLLSRIVLSPSHAKRFHRALGETLSRHEERFGTIDPGPTLQ